MEQLGEDPIHVPIHGFPYTHVSQVGVDLAGSLSSSPNLPACFCKEGWPELEDMDGTSPRLCNGLWSPCPALTPAVGLYRDTKPLPRSPGLGTSVGHTARLKAQAQISSVQRKVFIEMLAWTGGT